MEKVTSISGQSLIEILFAVALFTVSVVTIGYLIFDTHTSLRNSTETIQATLLASEGIEAVQGMQRNDYDSVSLGTFGLLEDNGVWTLSSSTDVSGKFVRSIFVSSVDTEVKQVVSTVTWNTTEVRENTVSLTDYVTDTGGTGGNVEYLNITTNGAVLSASNTVLSGITIENSSSTLITITGMILKWNGGSTLNTITLSGTTLYSVATSSGVSSGVFVNTTDYTLLAYGGVKMFDTIAFNNSMLATNFVMTIILSDGSRRHVLITL